MLAWFYSYSFVNSLASIQHYFVNIVLFGYSFIHIFMHIASILIGLRWKTPVVFSFFWQHTPFNDDNNYNNSVSDLLCKSSDGKYNTGYSIRQQVLSFASQYRRISCALRTYAICTFICVMIWWCTMHSMESLVLPWYFAIKMKTKKGNDCKRERRACPNCSFGFLTENFWN